MVYVSLSGNPEGRDLCLAIFETSVSTRRVKFIIVRVVVEAGNIEEDDKMSGPGMLSVTSVSRSTVEILDPCYWG